MGLVKTILIKDATGHVEQAYLKFLKIRGEVPKTFLMFSASPELLKAQSAVEDHFYEHPNLSFLLLGFIRLLVANELGFSACVDFNARLLKTAGEVMDRWVEIPMKDPTRAPLPEKEKALLLFVLRAIKFPEKTRQIDIDSLRELGWEDPDIFDATYHGAGIAAQQILFSAFKMETG